MLVLILFSDQLHVGKPTRALKKMALGDQNFVTFTFMTRWTHGLISFSCFMVYAGVVSSGIVNIFVFCK